jgi:predicted chitinase
MIISPPFLPAGSTSSATADEDAIFVNKCMPTVSSAHGVSGLFPLSYNLSWHGGSHVGAVIDARSLPVRAIADGELRFKRAPTKKPADPAALTAHPLNYRGQWTDDGVIVIKHDTEIGEGISVVFYSIYMHLRELSVTADVGGPIYRKDVLGRAGSINGATDRIHLEIVADEANMGLMMPGLKNKYDPAQADGDTKRVWGDVFFYLPAGQPVFAGNPQTPDAQSYTLTATDTPERVAAKFNTTVERLAVLNKKKVEQFPTWFNSKLSRIAHPKPHPTPVDTQITVPQIYDRNVSSEEDDTPNPVLHPVSRTGKALIVGLRLYKDSVTTTYLANGTLLGSTAPQIDDEYNLYTQAKEFYPNCASAGYELLRFGRILGPDDLHTNDTDTGGFHSNFRKISYVNADGQRGEGWVNLYATDVHVFSEADFAPAFGWTRVDDDTNGDSRCDSSVVYQQLIAGWLATHPDQIAAGIRAITALGKQVVLAANPDTQTNITTALQTLKQVLSTADLTSLLQDASVQERLSKLVCRFPSEWASDHVEQRWGWLKAPKSPAASDAAQSSAATLDADQYAQFIAHVRALCFWEVARANGKLDLDANQWHIEPREFIKQFRKCGWYSTNELAQLIPRQPAGVTWATASARFDTYKVWLNKCLRKYILHRPIRLAQFLAQVYTETGCMGTVIEGTLGAGHDYASFYGRGIMQLTWAGNYSDYGRFRNLPLNLSGTYLDTGNHLDPISATSVHEWQGPITDANGTVHHDRRQWAPRYDPALIASDLFNACDSGGFFWVTKHYTGQSNINRLVDTGFNTDTVGKTSVLVNGGVNGYNERQGYAAYIFRFLSDIPDGVATQTLNFVVYGIYLGRWLTHGNETRNVNYAPQRPR